MLRLSPTFHLIHFLFEKVLQATYLVDKLRFVVAERCPELCLSLVDLLYQIFWSLPKNVWLTSSEFCLKLYHDSSIRRWLYYSTYNFLDHVLWKNCVWRQFVIESSQMMPGACHWFADYLYFEYV